MEHYIKEHRLTERGFIDEKHWKVNVIKKKTITPRVPTM